MIFLRNFFNKIDAWISYLGDASINNHQPLRGRLGRQLRLEVIKACGEGGIPLRWHHFIVEATSSVRDVNKEQEQSRPLQLIVISKPLLFSR